jgi:hypothetical protein
VYFPIEGIEHELKIEIENMSNRISVLMRLSLKKTLEMIYLFLVGSTEYIIIARGAANKLPVVTPAAGIILGTFKTPLMKPPKACDPKNSSSLIWSTS